ncbi:MAG: hypothetical protein INF65_11755 [Roseomonas sp.]|nr:hypothetical protein [Roseomonas sp.]MCA3407626.1 hypothetical protein [Roseomonas sp.]
MVKAFLKLPAVVVHGREQAAWVLRIAAGRPVLLVSAPGAALNAGPGWFKAVLEQAAAEHPGANFTAALDCGAAPGAALAALRAGFKLVVFDLGHPSAASVLGAAAEAGAEVLGSRPEALDLGGLDPRQRDDQRRVAALFATVPPQDQPR